MKTLKTLFIMTFTMMVSDSLHAQYPTLEDEVISEHTQELDPSFITLAVENDLFGSGKDQYYTSGFRLSYFRAGAVPPSLISDIGELYPGFRINDTTSVTFSIGQNLYTPDNITITQNQNNDRPWAGWLYASAGLLTITNDHIDEIEMALGIVGSAALGEQTQKFVHEYISDSPEPKGWDNQLDNELGLNLSWQRRWPEWKTWGVGKDLWLSASPQIGLSLGNVYTHAETGMNFRLSPKSERFSDMPLRVRPAMPGTGYFPKLDAKDTSWSLFGGVNARAVGRNIFLDGNTFENSHSVDKKSFVYDVNAGVDVTYGQTRVSYTLVRRSEEFEGQNSPAIFGAISLSRRF
jgi:lipid A 3-O-deacylase